VKYYDHNDVFTYLNQGDFKGIVRDKLGQSMVDTMDILARNAFLTHPTPSYAGGKSGRDALQAADLFDPDVAEDVRVMLQEAEVPGLATNNPDQIAEIVCVTTPRVIHDIRTAAGSDWLDIQNYQGTGRKFSGEVGVWAGVRFVMTNRLRLRNAGAILHQTTLSGPTAEGQGAAASVDAIWTPGQATAIRYVTVADPTGFQPGDYVTLHDNALGAAVLETDGTQETRRIVNVDAANKRLAFDKPLLKAHGAGDYVTQALDIHASLFMGGPGVVYAVAERPNVIVPPKIDDVLLVNRIGWRGMFRFQLWNPVYYHVHYSAGSV